MFKLISKSEIKIVFWLIFFVVILTQAPFIYAFFNSTPNQIYDGLHSLSPADIPVYFSYINQGLNQQIFFKNLFTSEHQALGTFNAGWFLVAMLGKIFSQSAAFAFHFARFIFGPILLLVAYLFLSEIFVEKQKRLTAFVFLCFAGGIGFLSIPFVLSEYLKSSNLYYKTFWPVDLWLAQTNIFSSIYHDPHYILSWLCLILMFYFCLRLFNQKKIIWSLALGLVGLFYFNFHPYYIPLVCLVVFIYTVCWFLKNKKIDWLLVGYLIIAGLISLVSVIYHFYLMINDPVIGLRASQNVNMVFFVWPAILGFGFLLPLAVMGLYYAWKNKLFNDNLVLVFIWLVVNLFLIFSPNQFAQHYFEGLQMPLVIFSVIAIFEIKKIFQNKNIPWLKLAVENNSLLIIIFIFVFCLTNIFNIFRDLNYFQTRYFYFYLNSNMLDGFNWLEQKPLGQSLVLSSDTVGLLIPGLASQRCYYSHSIETMDLAKKEIWVKWFFADNNQDQQKKSWLTGQDINYLFYSDFEKQMGNFDPSTKDYLKPVFSQNNVIIYEVIKN